MSAADWIGIYGAAVATIVALAQAYAYYKANRRRIIVKLQKTPLIYKDGVNLSYAGAFLLVQTTNKSDKSVIIRMPRFESIENDENKSKPKC